MVKGAIEVYETTMSDQWDLRVPLQAAPIDRTPHGAAAFGNEAGVDASIDWGQVAGTVLQALPGVLGAFGV
jgi:hypothetical protein